VFGVDENGYGPLLGPMIVTGVVLDVEDRASLSLKDFLQLGITDSKVIYKRSVRSYAWGEALSLSLFQNLGRMCRGFVDIVDGFGVGRGLLNRERLCSDLCFKNIPLPIWFMGKCLPNVYKDLEALGIWLKQLFINILCPLEFNKMIKKTGSKCMVDFLMSGEIFSRFESGHYKGFCGKVGGVKDYKKYIGALGRFEVSRILREDFEESIYLIEGGDVSFEISFKRGADGIFLPTALASIIGKYIRELAMLSINRFFGRGGALPNVTGYRDQKTKTFVQATRHLRMMVSGFQDMCFLRIR
jgi:ribonuclease HII